MCVCVCVCVCVRVLGHHSRLMFSESLALNETYKPKVSAQDKLF